MYSVANQNSYTVFPNQEKNVPNSDMDPTFQHLKRNIKTKLQQNIKNHAWRPTNGRIRIRLPKVACELIRIPTTLVDGKPTDEDAEEAAVILEQDGGEEHREGGRREEDGRRVAQRQAAHRLQQ